MSGPTDRLRDVFRAAGRRWASQRRLILEVLEGSDAHLDAEALHDQVKRRDPGISLATVYRTLGALQEMGLVEHHHLGEEHGHYEAVQDGPHYHFTCLGCGRIVEFDTPLVAQIEQELHEREGVRVTDAHVELSGYCARCQRQAEGKRQDARSKGQETGSERNHEG